MPDQDRRSAVFTEERPWGDFESFCTNERVTVKIITVRPGQRLSLQKHAKRAELWTVLDDAPMDITLDGETFTAQRGQKIWVPAGGVHRMANSGTTDARILEVGFGDFDEDDIERLEDDYKRN